MQRPPLEPPVPPAAKKASLAPRPAAGNSRTPVNEGPTRAALERFVRWFVGQERRTVLGWPASEQRDAFLAYYSNLPADGDEAGIARYVRGMWNAETGWVMRWIAARRAEQPFARSPRILDAGSGFGTFSMLFALAGAEVTGVDLRDDSLEVATRRLELYRTSTGRALPIRYESADLTRDLEDEYDLVWLYNAISHIDPVEPFLRAVAENLTPGGLLVIGDINGANPQHLRRLDRARKEIHQIYIASDGGSHTYAVERPFPPRELRSLLHAHGFRVVRHELFYGGLATLPETLIAALKPVQQYWWMGERVARRQFVVAAEAEA